MSCSGSPNECVLPSNLVFLGLLFILEPWCCWSEWQMWRKASPPRRSWWKLKKKRPWSSSPLSTIYCTHYFVSMDITGLQTCTVQLTFYSLGSCVWLDVKAWHVFGYWLASCCRSQLVSVISLEVFTLKDSCQFGSWRQRRQKMWRATQIGIRIKKKKRTEQTHHLEQLAQTETKRMV